MNKKDVEAVLNRLLKAGGFAKKGPTWYRQLSDVLQVIDLQKSSYGVQFFLNICFVPDGIDVEGLPTPKERNCPIRIRMGSLFPELDAELGRVFDLENTDVPDSDREARIRDLTTNALLPFMNDTKDASCLRRQIEQGLFKRGAVSLDVQKQFGLV